MGQPPPPVPPCALPLLVPSPETIRCSPRVPMYSVLVGGLVMAATFARYYSKPPSPVCRLYTLLLSRPALAPGSDLFHAVSQVRDCGRCKAR